MIPGAPTVAQAHAAAQDAVRAGRLVAFRVRAGLLVGRAQRDPRWELVTVIPEGWTLPAEVDGRDDTSRAALAQAVEVST